jgi:hypothetical protein
MSYYKEYLQMMKKKEEADQEIIILKQKLQEQEMEIESLTKQLCKGKQPKMVFDNDGVIPWNLVFKKSHPGQLSYLSKQQKDKIMAAVKEFLVMKKGTDQGFYIHQKNGPVIGLPEDIIEDFQDWFNIQIDNGTLHLTRFIGFINIKARSCTKETISFCSTLPLTRIA